MAEGIPATADRRLIAWLIAGFAVATAVRILLLPTEGFRPDTDQFALWVHGLATGSLGEAYRMNLSFPPVMVYVFAILAALEPAFRTAVDASEPIVRVALKIPATLADLAIAVLAYRSLRSRPRVAVAAAVAVAIHPAFIDVSAWWGQFESIYALFGLLALLLAWSDRPYLAAVALALAVMAKPQALPFLVPFAAWFLGRYGLRRSIPIGIVWAAVVGLLWLPFVADGGPGRYLSNLDGYQNGVFAVLSLRAWNAWWLLQEAAGQVFLSDSGGLIGPITARHVGLVLAGLVELLVFVSVLRRPSARGLALGLAASTLVAFSLLTTMHERYAFAALVFLVPLIDDRRVAIVWIALGAVITLNLVAAIPPTPEIGRLLPVFGPLGIVGSLGMLSLTVASVALLRAEAGRGTPPRTSAGSGAATPGT